MSDRRPIRPWDAPVVRALDEVERLRGFEPDQVGWDNFGFYGSSPDRRMQSVSIYASQATVGGTPYVRFTVGTEGFTVTGRGRRTLTTSEVAHTLSVPIESVVRSVPYLESALTAALAAFNAAHAPRIRRPEPSPFLRHPHLDPAVPRSPGGPER